MKVPVHVVTVALCLSLLGVSTFALVLSLLHWHAARHHHIHNHHDLYFNLGNAYFNLEDYGNARWAYEMALDLSPRDEDIVYNLDNSSIVNESFNNNVTEKTSIVSSRFEAVEKCIINISERVITELTSTW